MKKEPLMISDENQIIDSVFKILFFDETAREINDEKLAFAKIHEYEGGKLKYFVLFDGFNLVDIYGANHSRRNRPSWKMKNVNKSCFDSYIKYLQTKKNVCLTNATRKVHDVT